MRSSRRKTAPSCRLLVAIIFFFFVRHASTKLFAPRRQGPGRMLKAQGTATATEKAKIEH
jgi:hypothetical protein